MKNSLFLLGSLFFYVGLFGQLGAYSKKMELQGVSETWHKINLPNTVFQEVSQNLSDIRIYGITEKDTIEAPYILKISKGRKTGQKVNFKLMNTGFNAKGHYFTYKAVENRSINEINLRFHNQNFDWRVVLEGSHDQKEWFTLLDDYRILAITSAETDYNFTKLKFPTANYSFYRIWVQSDIRPLLDSADIFLTDSIKPTYQDHTIRNFKLSEENKKTIVDVNLKNRIAISSLQLNISDAIDYYRSIVIQYVSDSTETQKGWKYTYRNLTRGILSSLENNPFQFNPVLAQKLRVIITDHDNRPLKIKGIKIKGFEYALIARFSEPAIYYLVYGNADADAPKYDISKTRSHIPQNVTSVNLGMEQVIPKKPTSPTSTLFEDQIYLWVVMGIVILILGGFTLKMMQQKNTD
ncbi:DUF3999 domain-containing protein [Maribacter sp. 2304DJ31-5]|uniref:DUF3999 domain-containing protein n=1 Tax=Maribacter sp. 2304DJ31-5 TaxID=3386273 RepID=UPI0039BCE4CF